jgi:hypothetical protein
VQDEVETGSIHTSMYVWAGRGDGKKREAGGGKRVLPDTHTWLLSGRRLPTNTGLRRDSFSVSPQTCSALQAGEERRGWGGGGKGGRPSLHM